MNIGQKIREQRQRLKMSLQTLSTLTGISYSYIHKLEMNKVCNPSLNILEKISEQLKVTLDYFINSVDLVDSIDDAFIERYKKQSNRVKWKTRQAFEIIIK